MHYLLLVLKNIFYLNQNIIINNSTFASQLQLKYFL
jgi:hypothetical protein